MNKKDRAEDEGKLWCMECFQDVSSRFVRALGMLDFAVTLNTLSVWKHSTYNCCVGYLILSSVLQSLRLLLSALNCIRSEHRTMWIMSSHKHACWNQKSWCFILSGELRLSSHAWLSRVSLYDFIFLCSLLSVSVLLPVSLFLSSLKHLGGFIHPNPSGLLTRPNSLHSFIHTSTFFLFFFLFNLFFFFISMVPCSLSLGATLTFPFIIPRLFSVSPLLLSANANPQSWALICMLAGTLAEFLPLKLSSCWASAQTYPGQPCQGVSAWYQSSSVTHKHGQTLTSCWPQINWGAYPVLGSG